MHKGDLSDLYVRLESQPCTNGKTYYTLVLDGYMCEKYPLAHKPTDDREILGKGLNFRGYFLVLIQSKAGISNVYRC